METHLTIHGHSLFPKEFLPTRLAGSTATVATAAETAATEAIAKRDDAQEAPAGLHIRKGRNGDGRTADTQAEVRLLTTAKAYLPPNYCPVTLTKAYLEAWIGLGQVLDDIRFILDIRRHHQPLPSHPANRGNRCVPTCRFMSGFSAAVAYEKRAAAANPAGTPAATGRVRVIHCNALGVAQNVVNKSDFAKLQGIGMNTVKRALVTRCER